MFCYDLNGDFLIYLFENVARFFCLQSMAGYIFVCKRKFFEPLCFLYIFVSKIFLDVEKKAVL